MRSIPRFFWTLRRLHAIWRHGLTALIVLLALGLRFVLWPDDAGYPFILFFLAVLACATLMDHRSGFLATGLSAVLAIYFFVPPIGSIRVQDLGDFIGTGVFVLIGLAIAATVETMHQLVARLDAAERQKDLLLRETNHRVLNNLQTSMALLSLQARAQTDERARDAFRQASDRLGVIARVHKRLHYRNGRDTVDVRELLAELTDLGDALGGPRPIEVRVTADPIEMDTQKAVQIGLIANELVTNALKHAFPGGRGGSIDVQFRALGPEAAEIVVKDDGIGCPAEAKDGLGTRLVRSLARQLDGEMTREPGNPGCTVTVRVGLAAD